ncbi:CHC2 zinc finger domain-containing protein [Anaerobutyricum hallii]
MFHNDKSPSMKVDRRYYCFGCGCTGVPLILRHNCLTWLKMQPEAGR